jgi:hypothetical protein
MQMKRVLTLTIFLISFSGVSQAQESQIPPAVFENPLLVHLVTLMDQHLLKMDCKPLFRQLMAIDGGYVEVTHSARDADVCVRRDVRDIPRPYFRSILFEAKASQDSLVSFSAKYPIEYQIPDAGSKAFFEAVALRFEETFLRGYKMRGQESNIKNGRGIIRRSYEQSGVYFFMEMTLSPNTEPLGSPESTVVRISTKWDA